jgi:imidazolonepropionase-like amidohydrolase
MVVRAARYFDGLGDAVVEGGVSVVVDSGLITRVGRSEAVGTPPGCDVVDLGDATLLPGFIDAHTHVSNEGSADYYKDDFIAVHRPATEQAFYAAVYARRLLEAGFTTVRDLGSHDLVDVGLRNAIGEDLVAGPRMLVAVRMLSATGGHGDDNDAPPGRQPAHGFVDGVCDSPDECVKAVREQVKHGADVIKVAASGGVLSLTDDVDASQLPVETLRAIVGEAHRLHRKVAAHCHGDSAAKAAVEAGVDSIEHGSFLQPDTLAMMKRKGTVLVPTLVALDWLSTGEHASLYPPRVREKALQAAQARARMFHEALKAGVTIGFGTDSGVGPHGANALEFSLLTSLGMTPAAALRAATSVDAALLGVDRQTGTLEPGKLADIVAVPGNPLVDIHRTEHVVFVMRAGRVYKRPQG